jgi:hypothetical protein
MCLQFGLFGHPSEQSVFFVYAILHLLLDATGGEMTAVRMQLF